MSQLKTKKTLLTLLLILVIAGGAAYYYFGIYRPLVLEVDTTQKQWKAEQQLIKALEKQNGPVSSDTRVVTNNLQHQVPVKPMTEKLLLDFEKIELLSSSLIKTIAFTEGEAEVEENTAEEDLEERNTSATKDSAAGVTDGDEEQEDQEESEEEDVEVDVDPAPVPEVLPPGIKKISAQLTVESPGYFEMEKFLEEMENEIRIIEIENLTFTGPEELSELEGKTEPLTYNVVIAAYYMPDLIELLEDSPKLDTPPPAKKEDPFVRIN
ncbi:type IV pilus assembly protein PilO [Bacillus ectoiniformans]|uniref:hypothetical protein n=1 Tax=Bacillus ectoiniformans TaxID=1494429 RepID=UPI00195D8BA4|nr:hypothetical protein [Bacillus ectoiniformans]MBM7648943.1 type IV pilus assembly protein PilO [Bacillus ectoiniformans]